MLNENIGSTNDLPFPLASFSSGSLDTQGSYHNNTVIGPDYLETGRIIVCPVNCRSPYCGTCAYLYRRRLAASWFPTLKTFRGVVLYTLTINPKLFADGQEALDYVRQSRSVAVLMRSLFAEAARAKASSPRSTPWFYTERYCWVLEFQSNGFPHWHGIFDADFVSVEVLQRLWNARRPSAVPPAATGETGFGWVDLRSKDPRQNKLDALNNILDYVSKVPEGGYPGWVLERGGREGHVHRHGTSRGFKLTCLRSSSPKPKSSNRKRKTHRSPGRTFRERQEECGQTSNLVEELNYDPVTGEAVPTRFWRRSVDVSASDIRAINNGSTSSMNIITATVDEATEMLGNLLGRPVQVTRRPAS